MLLGPDTGAYLGLDAVAADIWAKLATPMSLDALAAALAEDYDAPASRIAEDIAPFLVELSSDGLIETIAPDGPDAPDASDAPDPAPGGA